MRDLPIAYGNSCYAKTWANKTTTWEDLCERLKTTIRTTESVEEYPKLKKDDRDRAKDKGGFVGGNLKGNRRKRETVACRSMLTMDADHAEIGFIDKFTAECRYTSCLYTTHGHTPEQPRCRIIVPLTRDITPDEYVALARYFAADWGIDQFDECSYKPSQLMYWPTTPANGEFISKTTEGEWLDPDVYLSAHPNWKDCSLLPTSSRESAVREASGKKQEDPLAKPGVVGAFCRAYGIAAVIETYLADVYEPSAMEGRYDYISADSSAGVVIYDDKFAYSHHATDPACGKLLNAFDLVRIHRFGDDDEKKSFKQMTELALADDTVKECLTAERIAQAGEDFSDDADWHKRLHFVPRSGALENSVWNLNLITGTNTKKRDGFNRMIEDALAGKIDLILTKSVSRFARNTVDSLVTIRQLKEKGVEVFFEKENIYTLDAKGELLLTIMSSLAQEEARSISENTSWGRRKSFADGKVSLGYSNFLGYDKGPDGELVINEEQAKIVRRIYAEFLAGKTPGGIAKGLTADGIETPGHKKVWQASTVLNILKNEKYYGAAILQKEITVSYLTKEKRPNTGELPMYYIEKDHEPIVSPETYQMVQEEMRRRKEAGSNMQCVSIFSSRIICGDCGGYYGRKIWHSSTKYTAWHWHCNAKFQKRKHCETPTLKEESVTMEIPSFFMGKIIVTLFPFTDIPSGMKPSVAKSSVLTRHPGSALNSWKVPKMPCFCGFYGVGSNEPVDESSGFKRRGKIKLYQRRSYYAEMLHGRFPHKKEEGQ